MTRVTSLYETCRDLFIRYPLATRGMDGCGVIRSMVLMRQDDDGVSFFLLSRSRPDSDPASYSLRRWPHGDIIDIEADDVTVSPDVARAVTRGIPLPRHGSLFGWLENGSVLALVGCDWESESSGSLPRWSVMPLVGSPESQWPPFTNESLFGDWFWDYCRAGSLVSLDSLIFETPDTVFWVNTQASIGSDCCVVTRDVAAPARWTLRNGRYVASEVLQAGTPVPLPPTLLADDTKVDLAPRFRRYAHDDASHVPGQ